MGNGLEENVVNVRTVYGARIVKVFEREDENEECEERTQTRNSRGEQILCGNPSAKAARRTRQPKCFSLLEN